jgi:hypothetical protein
MEKQGFFCEVTTEILCAVLMAVVFKRLCHDRAVSRRPLTPDVPVYFHNSQYWICGGRSGNFAQFAPDGYVLLLYHCTSAHTHLHLLVTLSRKTKGRRLGTLKVKFFRKSGRIEEKN